MVSEVADPSAELGSADSESSSTVEVSAPGLGSLYGSAELGSVAESPEEVVELESDDVEPS